LRHVRASRLGSDTVLQLLVYVSNHCIIHVPLAQFRPQQ
jgi:hypothetical protein